jgi:hypothetical protein
MTLGVYETIASLIKQERPGVNEPFREEPIGVDAYGVRMSVPSVLHSEVIMKVSWSLFRMPSDCDLLLRGSVSFANGKIITIRACIPKSLISPDNTRFVRRHMKHSLINKAREEGLLE